MANNKQSDLKVVKAIRHYSLTKPVRNTLLNKIDIVDAFNSFLEYPDESGSLGKINHISPRIERSF